MIKQGRSPSFNKFSLEGVECYDFLIFHMEKMFLRLTVSVCLGKTVD